LLKNVIPGSIRNEKHPSGAEARVDIDELSGTTEVAPFQNKSFRSLFQQAVKAVPFKTASLRDFSASCFTEGPGMRKGGIFRIPPFALI
jgi:hypothetical protein